MNKKLKERKKDKTKKKLEFAVGFLLVWVIALSVKVIQGNKYDTLENYLTNYYYSADNVVTAMSNKLGDKCENNDSKELFLSLNFDNYIYELVLDDINQYESEEISNYNIYMNRIKGEEILNRIEGKEPSEVHLMGEICYIKIPGFEKDGTYEELKEYQELLSQNRKFIIDLRDNSGGSLDELIDVMSLFYEKGSVVCTNIGSKEITEQKTNKGKIVEFDQIIFLCNENTASASEAMMFNMKSDFGDRVEFVGSKTYGKNFCCSYEEFKDGEVFMFVSGYMGNAKGVTFEDDGIEPDHYAEDNECIEKAMELLQ